VDLSHYSSTKDNDIDKLDLQIPTDETIFTSIEGEHDNSTPSMITEAKFETLNASDIVRRKQKNRKSKSLVLNRDNANP